MKDTKGAVSFRAVMKKELEVCVPDVFHGWRGFRLTNMSGHKEEGYERGGGYDSELHPGCEERRYAFTSLCTQATGHGRVHRGMRGSDQKTRCASDDAFATQASGRSTSRPRPSSIRRSSTGASSRSFRSNSSRPQNPSRCVFYSHTFPCPSKSFPLTHTSRHNDSTRHARSTCSTTCSLRTR